MKNRSELELLADVAQERAPRLFAIYGLMGDDEDMAIGWGMEFTEDQRAIAYFPYESSTHYSASAQGILETHELIGDARLRWLDTA
jgi:hypothetical protein